MFTGLIKDIGTIENIAITGAGRRLVINTSLAAESNIGDSIAVNGVCLTVTDKSGITFTVDAVSETIERSTLGRIVKGNKVNLEPALQANGRLDGHFVQGHVDGVAVVTALQSRAPGLWLNLELPQDLNKLCVEKGSIAIDGISLTIAEIKGKEIAVAVIPHTTKETIIQTYKNGTRVNIEVDIIGKYLYKFVNQKSDLSMDKMKSWGY